MSRSNAAAALLFRRKGDGSTLNLDFTAMSSLDSRVVLTRSANTATYINSSGYVTTAAQDVARFEYDPTTLAAKGLLIEGQGINLTNYSNTFDTAFWNFDGFTRTIVTGTAPSGTGQSILQSQNAAGGNIRSNGVTVTASTAYTFSFWAKNNGGTKANYRVWNASAGSPIVDHTLPASSYFAQLSSTVWNRISVTFTTPAGCTLIYIYPISEDSTGSNLYFWGAQLELGSAASSYIPTVASQVTRNPDVCSMSGTNFSSWFNNTEGTVLFIGNNNFVPSPSNFSANWALISAANSSRIAQYTRHTTGRIGASCRDSGGVALTFDSPSATTLITTTAEYKTAFALKSSDFAYSVNGAAIGTGDGVGVFETVTSLDFARDGIRNGHIKCFKFWPTRLTNAQLIAIST